MRMIPFTSLPENMQNEEVKHYYDILKQKNRSLFFKRMLDLSTALFLCLLLLFPMFVISLIIMFSSKGPVIYKQVRVTSFNKEFHIWKFRTMKVGSDALGELTCSDDDRVTSVGKFLRKYRLDELPQIFHVISGKMSIVGTRPEVPRYVKEYTPEMMATLLMPAGVTSLASIMFKDEAELLSNCEDADEVYIKEILPQKMKYNLEYLKEFSFRRDIKLILKTVKEVVSS